MLRAVVEAQREMVIDQLTDIPQRLDPRHITKDMTRTNQLRTEGTKMLIEAAKAGGAHHFLAQSIATYYPPDKASPATEEELLYLEAPSAFAENVQAVARLENIALNTPGINGIVLRYGYLYGSGTAYAVDGSFTEDIRHQRVPIVSSGSGVFSFIHVEDAADATVLAVNRGDSGIFNIVDDDPAPIREWLPIYADLCGAVPPMHVTKLVGRFAVGRYGIYFMTEQRGASNNKAKQTFSWLPKYRSWCDGLRVEFVPQTILSDLGGYSRQVE